MKVGYAYLIDKFEHGPGDGIFTGVDDDGGPVFRSVDTGEIVSFPAFEDARPPAPKLAPRPVIMREPENLRIPDPVEKAVKPKKAPKPKPVVADEPEA